MRKLDLNNQKFQNLTVIKKAGHVTVNGIKRHVLWECVCDCGNIKIAQGRFLKSGHTD